MGPRYRAIVEALAEDLASGELPAGRGCPRTATSPSAWA